MLTALLASLVLASPAPQQPAADDLAWNLTVAGVVYYPDGHKIWTDHPRWHNGPRPFDDEIVMSDTLCIFGRRGAATPLGYGWQVEMTPVSSTADAVTVRVRWHRSLHRGVETAEPGGDVVLTLTPGLAIPLDYIVPGPLPQGRTCRAIGMSLEIRLAPQPNPLDRFTEADVWLVKVGPGDTEETFASRHLRARVGDPASFSLDEVRFAEGGTDIRLRFSGVLRTIRVGDDSPEARATCVLELTRVAIVGDAESTGTTTYTFSTAPGSVAAVILPSPPAGMETRFALRIRIRPGSLAPG
jgi:hypothetical protein